MTKPTVNESFAHNWTATILPGRPLILPPRHYVYPAMAEEVERGALEVLVRSGSESFLATCALGFRDPATPTGVWSMPDPDWLCAASGGYVYLVDVIHPERFSFLRYRPVLEIYCYSPDFLEKLQDRLASSGEALGSSAEGSDSPPEGLLLFLGHHSILAWSREGEAWESDRLSWEGITVDGVEGQILHGHGWDLMTDKDLPFSVDLKTGQRV